jgi:hypothetical protein
MPQYVILIFESTPADELPPEVLEAHGAVDDQMRAAGGKILAGVALQDPSTATSIRGELLTDGPFIETKEVLAGLTVIEARDLDHAIALARMVPIAEGGVEVRPLLGYEVFV